MKIEYFKAQKQTHRFRKNQNVWIQFNYANYLDIYFRWRGKGRYVRGTIDKFHTVVGKIKNIDVSDNFARHKIKTKIH